MKKIILSGLVLLTAGVIGSFLLLKPAPIKGETPALSPAGNATVDTLVLSLLGIPADQKNTVQLARVDLNHDGTPEVIASVNSPIYCGSRGCRYTILQQLHGRWKIVNEFVLFHMIAVDPEHSTRGYSDLILGKYRWQWDGTTYQPLLK